MSPPSPSLPGSAFPLPRGKMQQLSSPRAFGGAFSRPRSVLCRVSLRTAASPTAGGGQASYLGREQTEDQPLTLLLTSASRKSQVARLWTTKNTRKKKRKEEGREGEHPATRHGAVTKRAREFAQVRRNVLDGRVSKHKPILALLLVTSRPCAAAFGSRASTLGHPAPYHPATPPR